MWTEAYLRLRFAPEGVTPPAVNCWGLYRLIVKDRRGVELPEHPAGAGTHGAARRFAAGQSSGDWLEVVAGEERELDLVLMRDLVGRGRHARFVALHCGAVVVPGRLIHIEEGSGVLIQEYRDTPRWRAHPEIKHAVLGLYRPAALA